MEMDWVGRCIGSGMIGGIIGITLSSKVTLFLPVGGSLITLSLGFSESASEPCSDSLFLGTTLAWAFAYALVMYTFFSSEQVCLI